MGRVVRAATAVAAPEAAAVSGVAGAARRGRSAVPDPRVAAPGSTAAKQRQAIEDLKAARPAPSLTPPGDGADPADPSPPAPRSSQPAPAGLSMPSITVSPAAQTSSGFVLGLFLWGWVGLPYLRGGSSEVRRTLAAKFLNKTSAGAVTPPAPGTGKVATGAAAAATFRPAPRG